MLLPGPDLHCAGPPVLSEFCNIFLPNTGEDQKTSCHLSAVPLALCHMVNPSLVIRLHYDHEKVRRWPELATFRTKILNLTPVIHSNWLAKIELRGPGPLVVKKNGAGPSGCQSLHVICDLGPPPKSKILATPMVIRPTFVFTLCK